MNKLIIIAGAAVLSAGAFAGSFIGDWAYGPGNGVSTNLYSGSGIAFDTVRNSSSGGTDTLLPGNPVHFTTLCTELGEYIYNNSTQIHDRVELLTGNAAQTTWAGGSTGVVSFTSTRVSQLERLWYQLLTGGPLNNSTAAAFQLAQWEIVFDNGLSLGGGAFFDTGSADAALAQTYLNNANNLSTGRAAVYLMSDDLSEQAHSSTLIQDQITGRLDRPPGGNSVPEPFTMGLGIAAAGAFVRRRMKKSA